MMDEAFERYITKLLKIKSIKEIGIATVHSVDGQKCDLKRDGQADLLEVRLTASNDIVKNKVIEIPSKGSEVIYGIIEGLEEEAVILKVSEVDEVIVQIGTVVFIVAKTGVEIKKGTDTLEKVISDLITETSLITPSTPANTVKLAEIKIRLSNILK